MIDGASLRAFRTLFGALLVVCIGRYFAHGWIDVQFSEPGWFFTWAGFEWVRPWPRPWMYVHFAALGVAAFCLAAGLRPRLAAGAFAVGFTYVHLIDKTNYLNHYYLIGLLALLLVFVPIGRTAPAWGLRLLRFQVGAVYVFAGIAKLDADWLFRGEPLGTWLSHVGSVPVAGALLAHPGTAIAASWAGAALDLSAPFLLLWRPARPWAFVVVVVFHVLTAVLFSIGMFPWIMIGCATLFLDPSWPRPFLPGHPAPAPRAAPGRLGLAGRAAVGAFVAVQVALPFRCLLHPGDVFWTERGFRFSWRVMLMEKHGHVVFHVRRPGRAPMGVDPIDHLTPVQVRMMATQPDMIRQFARHLGSLHPGAEVRADAWASLNGRPGRWLLDPDTDLVEARHAPVTPSPRRTPAEHAE